jgi:hypothetical protein
MRVMLAASCVALMLFAQLAAGQEPTQLEADVFYKSAEGYFSEGDYENALMSVYRAREIYSQVRNDWGVQRCNGMIGKIEGVLAPAQLANMYYGIAGTYFTVDSKDTTTLQRAIDMATRAKTVFATVVGPAGTAGKLKCDDLIQRAIKLRDDIINNCIRQGDQMVDKSQNAFFQEYYQTARMYATNASEKYLSCPDQNGADAAAALLTSINNRIYNLRTQAKASYDKAIEYYASGTPDSQQRCVEYALAAQNIYTKINDQEGSSSASLLASRCRKDINQFEELKRKEAAEYYEEAKRLSIIPDCINATDRANKAMAIYRDFYNQAYEREKTLTTEKQVNLNLYKAFMSDVGSVLSKIMSSCTSERMLQIAEDFYKRSQQYYLDNQLNEAIAYANNARSLFSQFKSYVGLSKCDTLITQINVRIEQRNEGDNYAKEAEAAYNVANFDYALVQNEKARVIFTGIYDRDRMDKTQNFSLRIKAGMRLLEDANLQFGKARSSFELRKYNDALPPATASNRIYTEINYSYGMQESQRIMDESQKAIDEANAKFMTNVIIFGTLFLLSAFLIVQYRSRKQAVETDYRRRVSDQEDRERRKDEEWTIKSEEETKTKVEDELRKMIENERGKIDDV